MERKRESLQACLHRRKAKSIEHHGKIVFPLKSTHVHPKQNQDAESTTQLKLKPKKLKSAFSSLIKLHINLWFLTFDQPLFQGNTSYHTQGASTS